MFLIPQQLSLYKQLMLGFTRHPSVPIHLKLPYSLPGELSCQITQPFEDQAWEKRKKENEWRHHHFYFRLHILDKRLERGWRM